jgi:ABC-type transport system substrate-binding protein
VPRRRLLPLILALLAGCGAESGPRSGGTVVIGASSDLDAANPLVSVDAWTNEILRYALFIPLVRYGPDLSFEPYLATSWDVSGDTLVTFHLRRDVAWHDGTPTTAEDVLFTFQRAIDPSTAFPNAGYFAHWISAEVVDSFTVRFRMEPHAEPLAGWPTTPWSPGTCWTAFRPSAMRDAAFNRSPVGNGPFRFVSQRANDRWVFEANPDFPEALGGRPLLDRLVWRVIADNTGQITELRVGTVDLVLQPSPDQVERAWSQRDGIRVVRSRPGSSLHRMERKPAPLDDPGSAGPWPWPSTGTGSCTASGRGWEPLPPRRSSRPTGPMTIPFARCPTIAMPPGTSSRRPATRPHAAAPAVPGLCPSSSSSPPAASSTGTWPRPSDRTSRRWVWRLPPGRQKWVP